VSTSQRKATSESTPTAEGPTPADAALRVLLLEDVDTDAELAKRELRREELDFTARRAADRDGFVEALRAFDPDIILADYSLPSFDGLTALQLAQEHCPDVPVVFVSGAIGEERAIETLRQGATDYVLKDRLSRLGPAVRRALREAEERRARERAEAALRRAHDELEQKVKARTAALRESQERLTAIIDAAIDAIISIDADLEVTLFNAAAEKIFRCEADDARGASIEPLLTPAFRALIQQYIDTHAEAEGAASGTNGRYVAAPEGLSARRTDGTTFPVEATLCPVPLSDGLQYLIILRDIDELKQAEEELTQLKSEQDYLREELKSEYNFEEIVGRSPAIQTVFDAIDQVAGTETTVLVAGETGTGKELVARALHNRSQRSDSVLVKVNCAALSSDLIESELFGHEKGAFTGATQQREGRFELADGGTLFLDEIGELPLDTQAKLLRALQEQEFERVGGSRTIHVDTRIIAATNRDLEQDVEQGTFRSDLYYRLNIFPIQLPPLRERREDIPLLANHFCEKFSGRMGKEVTGVSPNAMAVLERYDWPGNVRELANIVERAVILTDDRLVRAEHLAITNGHGPADASFATLEEAQRQHIIQALEQTGGVVGGAEGAAALLDVKRTTLLSRMDRLDIDPGAHRS